MKSISYIISAYNEEAIIAAAIEECIEALSKDFANNYEIIVVNDCSSDNTGNILDSMAAKYSQLKIIHNPINLNLGISILIGFQAAKYEHLVYNAADLPLDPAHTKNLLDQMGDADILVLQRTGYKCTPWRKLASKLNTALLFILFPLAMRGTPILNYTQFYRRDILHKITPLARSPIFVWPELIFRAKHLNLKIKNTQENARIKTIRKGSFGKPHDIIWALTDMLRFRIRMWLKKI